MGIDETASGLRRIADLAPDFELGEHDPVQKAQLLLKDGRIRVRISWEFVMDLQNTPGHQVILEKGLALARAESRNATPRVVSIAGDGIRIDAE